MIKDPRTKQFRYVHKMRASNDKVAELLINASAGSKLNLEVGNQNQPRTFAKARDRQPQEFKKKCQSVSHLQAASHPDRVQNAPPQSNDTGEDLMVDISSDSIMFHINVLSIFLLLCCSPC